MIKSASSDPVENLALERELLVGRSGDFLLLYINRPCVVVGRNQNPAAEADIDWCFREGIPVLRRISGGGAVWHDGGNVNWSFIGPTDGVSPLDERPLRLVVAALGELGVEAEAGPRGGITVGGRKVSGTATCVTGGRRLFHGTLLFDSDLDAMGRALAGDGAQRGRKVASVPSPTTNLKPLLGRFDTGREFLSALAASMARLCQN